MTDFLLLVVCSSAAVAYATPKQLSALREAGIAFPLRGSPAVLQGIILSAISAGLGVALREFTPFLLLGPADFIGPTLVSTLIGFLGHLLLYYAVFRPRIPRHAALLSERIRLDMGLLARVLQGGIAEEVQFRWGSMSFVVAIANPLFPPDSVFPLPIALVVSALLFALIHFIGARQIGIAQNRFEVALTMVDNAWAGLIFGWLLWKYGLIAAMISHALFHVAWFPIEKFVYHRDRASAKDA